MKSEPAANLSRPLQSGFGNEFESQALPGALPVGRNSPQKVAYGLYAEQISGTSFTAPRADNRRSWLYRIRPSAMHMPFERISNGRMNNQFDGTDSPPNQLRWDPLPLPVKATDFIDGLTTMGGNGHPSAQSGAGIHIYCANRSMTNRYFCNADAEMLIVPQLGRLRLLSEFGVLDLEPQEIVVLPRGVRCRIEFPDLKSEGGDLKGARGYVCENFGTPFRLPDLGPIGSNGLANPRDFLYPNAAFEDREGKFELVTKYLGNLWSAAIGHSPLDVVAWHGNHVPYKYDLRRFNTIGSISYDHPDPSIFLVLQAPSDTPGVDMIDFVIFPPRIMVARDTFRPPWFHRNIASEFVGLIHGQYDAKASGFIPGAASLHNCMIGHGPDAPTFDKASNADTTQPHVISDTMAFMFETRMPIQPSEFALQAPQLQRDYYQCWQDLQKNFRASP